jgi:hypothetical protein
MKAPIVSKLVYGSVSPNPENMLVCLDDAPIMEVELNLTTTKREYKKEMKVSDAIMYEGGKQKLVVVDGTQGRKNGSKGRSTSILLILKEEMMSTPTQSSRKRKFST